jgi:glycosyltransferase involved in cell wall biosynthesis
LTAPLVTLVTPSFNQAPFLEEAIESALAQDYAALEYAVVDGGSTDGSVDVIRRYEDRLAWWTSGPDGGQAAALNTAFARARGEILGWLGSDDALLPGAVTRVVSELERKDDALLVYGGALFVDEQGREIFPLEPRPFDVETMVRTCANHVVQPGSLFRRRAFELAGPFDERGYYFFDFEFVLRLAQAAPGSVRAINERLATYRVHPGSKSAGAPAAKARDYVRFADEFLARSDLPGADAGRRSAYLAAGEYFYDALELGPARRYLLRGLRPSPRALGLLARSFLPRALVVRAKAARG